MKIQTSLFGELVLLTECTLVGSSESLGFQTFINTSHNGTEKRKALRETASQVLNINYVTIRKAMAQNFNVLYGGMRKLWAIPVDYEWQNVEAVSGDFISCDTSIFDFHNDSLAVLRHADGYSVVEILEVGPNGLKLYDPVDVPVSKLCPLRVGFILGDVSSGINAVFGTPSIQFQVVDAPYLNSPAPSQFLGKDIYFKRLLLEGDSLNVSLVQHQTIVDFGFGPIDQHTNWLHARYGKPMRSVMKTQQELFEYRQFLFRRLGQFREFWLPTFERNFHVKSTGTVNTVVDVESNQYLEYASGRKHIAIKDKAGNWTAHTITSAVTSGANVRLTISPTLSKPAVNIERVSYLGLYRLNNDQIDIQYKGAHITESSVSILEITP